MSLRREDTPAAKDLWRKVDNAAARCPEWVRENIEKILGGGGAVGSVYEQVRTAGCAPYGDPEALTPDMVDPAIWPAVKAINESGWLWTGESCQGHPDAEYSMVWAGNVRPYLRLMLRTEHEARLMPVLLDASELVHDESMGSDQSAIPYFPSWSMSVHSREKGWTCVYLYVKAGTAYERDMGCRFLEFLGHAASPKNWGDHYKSRIRKAATERGGND